MRPTEHSPIIDAILDYYADKHSIKETAEKFGVSIERVKYLAKREGVHNNRSAKEVCTINGAKGLVIQKQEAETKLAIRCLEHGFGYIGGYDGKGSQVTFTHLACGSTFNRRSEHFDKYGWKCPVCEEQKRKAEREEAERLKEAERIARQEERERKRVEREERNPLGLSYYQLEREKRLDEKFTCKVCGKEYRLRDYVSDCGLKFAQNPGYCSAECREQQKRESRRNFKRLYKDSNYRQRARHFGVEYQKGITLKKAVARFGLTCALCGDLCDWNDRSWSQYCGATYPSIDHIIPMSKGGGHTWNNVQVAHILCNSKKETKIDDTPTRDKGCIVCPSP